MSNPNQQSWEHFKRHYTDFPTLGLALDLSRMNLPENFCSMMEARVEKAFVDMAVLEKGAIANVDEGRMVGHYWLRNPSLAPTSEIRREIEESIRQVKKFAAAAHEGTIRGAKGVFKNILIIGIGGSALGPQFVAHALSDPLGDKMRSYFFDNTDPDGMHRVLATIGPELGQTICLVISKSGGTKETRNGMLEAKAAFEEAGLQFEEHTVAITKRGSELDQYAEANKWIDVFPMWDWVGGRTSECSVVGLLPAALQGFKIDELLAGAKACDEITRLPMPNNPAALLAVSCFLSGEGRGVKNMVVMPYKDRLELLGRYLQQLVMESLGKKRDLAGIVVHQGLSVYGNKGSTDQHAYIQQLREGQNDFFLVLVEVLNDHQSSLFFVEPDVSSGDYLSGFLLGNREAISSNNRDLLRIAIHDTSAFSLGVLIALFERAVGLYASLININAYNQPGVESGKREAAKIISLQSRIVDFLSRNPRLDFSAEEIARSVGGENDIQQVFNVCEHLSANPQRGIQKLLSNEAYSARYFKVN